MSLRMFHIIFIILSILLAFGFAAWEVNAFIEIGENLRLVAGLISFVVGVSLILYAIRFSRKFKSLRPQ